MNLIIDGYNVLHTAKIFEKALDEQKLINTIIKYKSIRNHTITLVFDGGTSLYPYEVYKQGITLLYSGTLQTADDAIINLLKSQKNMGEKVLISTDRALCEKAHQYHVISIDSDLFYNIVKDRITEYSQQKNIKKFPDNVIKYTQNSNEEIDRLMMQGTIIEKDKPMYTSSVYTTDNKSFKNKRIAEILEKL